MVIGGALPSHQLPLGIPFSAMWILERVVALVVLMVVIAALGIGLIVALRWIGRKLG